MKMLIDVRAGEFYALDKGHAIFNHDRGPSEYSLGSKFELNAMFDMWSLCSGDEQVGYYFVSGFKTENKGGYVLTYMESKRGRATSHRLVIRLPELMVYDFPSCGTIAISTKVSPKVESIFMEQ
jgi:hypothetical protein